MPKCTDGAMGFGRLGRRVIEANFEGGDRTFVNGGFWPTACVCYRAGWLSFASIVATRHGLLSETSAN